MIEQVLVPVGKLWNNKTNILRSAALFISLSVFFSATTPASAYGVAMPSTLQVEGLTIDTPLDFSNNPQTDNALYKQFKFGIQNTLLVNDKPKSDSVADMIVEQPVPVIPLPTDTPTPNPTSTPKPVKIKEVVAVVAATPTPTATPELTATPQPTVSSNPGGLNADTLFNMVQDYRTANNLPPFQKDDRACNVAEARAPQVQEEIDDGHMHSGLRAMNLPYWNSENIITMRTEEEAFNWWIHDPIHHEAIVGDYKYSCLACSGNACAEEFTNFQPK